MSEEEQVEATPQMIAQFKDGQLQIVEVTPFQGVKDETHILPDLNSCDEQQKYAVLDSTNGLVKLDLLNLRLVRCPNGEEQYQLVSNDDTAEGDVIDENTVTCLLETSDNEDPDNQESYVMVEGDGGQGPLVFLQSSLQPANQEKKVEENIVQEKKQLTPADILEKARALQKAKTLIQTSRNRSNRKRKSDLPPPHELLALPNFKLYLYSCKHCSFKCNAIREMSAHKAAEHRPGSGSGSGSGGRSRGPWRGPAAITLQCARCPYRGNTHSQLMKHVHEKHVAAKTPNTVHLDTEEVEAADVLVCGACGFESSSRPDFRKHIEDEHGATTS